MVSRTSVGVDDWQHPTPGSRFLQSAIFSADGSIRDCPELVQVFSQRDAVTPTLGQEASFSGRDRVPRGRKSARREGGQAQVGFSERNRYVRPLFVRVGMEQGQAMPRPYRKVGLFALFA